MKRDAAWFVPAAPALLYPFLLHAFSEAAGAAGTHPNAALAVIGWLCLLMAGATPLIGLGWAYRLRGASDAASDRARVRARTLAFLTMIAPPLFVFIGVTRGLIGHPLSDETIWLVCWGAAILFIGFRSPAPAQAPPSWLRVAHGVLASLIVLFVAFHLSNHLSGLVGPELHAAIMKAGRTVYRFPLVEVLLVGLLLGQIVTGLVLARRWARLPGDGFRVLQIGSGLYLAAFIVAHLNSALISARAVRHIETDWAWASGAPEGLIHDAWNIRLVPHYGWGAFFVLAHLSLGLRQIMIAHGVPLTLANRLWVAGIIVCGLVAVAITAALLGLRA